MRIAELIEQNGVTAGGDFKKELSRIVKERKITNVLETGTHLGLGTTKGIIEGLIHGNDFQFISIEVNPDYYKQAVRNVGQIRGVTIWNGLSFDRKLLPESYTFDVPDEIIVDHMPLNRSKLYKAETDFNVEDKLIDRALLLFTPQLVLLDSGGHVGFIEFQYLIDRMYSPFLLALDDTLHVKHYHSMEFIKNNPDKFTIIYETDRKFGSAIIEVK